MTLIRSSILPAIGSMSIASICSAPARPSKKEMTTLASSTSRVIDRDLVSGLLSMLGAPTGGS
jgi:hypothetical protein